MHQIDILLILLYGASVATLTLFALGRLFEDVRGRGGPDEGFGFGIVLLEIGFNCGLEFGDAAEDAAASGVAGDQAEEALDQINPGGRGWREVEVKAGVALEPSFDLGMLMRCVLSTTRCRSSGLGVSRSMVRRKRTNS